LSRLRHFSRGRFVVEKNLRSAISVVRKALQNIEKANDLVADPLGSGGPGARDYQP
jgi:DNA-binding winged helix-turn-helix (wHTH) protein